MIKVRHAGERGLADFGWLKSRHTFSFGDYHDPDFMGHGSLRVINEDEVAPAKGFGAHSHADMEILSWVLDGALEHQDSIGSKARIKPGELQRMTAGTGVTHSEYNASTKDSVHFLQIWIIPAEQGLKPDYEQKAFADGELRDRLRLVASSDGRDGSVVIHQDAELFIGRFAAGAAATHPFRSGRLGWLQVARGEFEVGSESLAQGDGAAIENEGIVRIRAKSDGELLLFDMTP